MAVLGLLLLAAAGVLTAAVVTSNTGAVETDLWNATLSNVSLGVVFVAGMLTMIVAAIGIAMLMGGVRRNQRLRQERRVLRRENQRLSQRVDSGATPEYPVADQRTDRLPRGGLFTPRRSTSDTTADDGRHADTQDRVVASDTRETSAASTE
ncbi:MAG: hypothetical protein V7637_5392 [Mycobacteriales bacterium]